MKPRRRACPTCGFSYLTTATTPHQCEPQTPPKRRGKAKLPADTLRVGVGLGWAS